MIANYHTHTRWCRHATGEIEDYIKAALAAGLEELAITEHVPLPGNPDNRRLFMEEFDDFNSELDSMITKYQGALRVRKGLECEYSPNLLSHYKNFKDNYNYEIFILGQHTNPAGTLDYFNVHNKKEIAQYANEVCEGLETGFFTFLAHPDVPLSGYKNADDYFLDAMGQIFATCAKLNIPAEINVNGHVNNFAYPCKDVWKHAKNYDISCLVNADAHSPLTLSCPSIAACEKIAHDCGLSLLSTLP